MRLGIFCLVFSSFLFAADRGMELIPASVSFVAKWDVGSSMEIEGVRNAFKDDDGDIKRLIQYGLNPYEDIEEAYFGLKTQGEEDARFLGAVRYNRKVDLEKVITSYAEFNNEHLKKSTYKGVTIFETPEDKEDGDTFFMSTQLGGEWSFLGDLTLVQQAIDCFKGEGKSVTGNDELMKASQNGLLPHLFWAAGNLNVPGQGTGYRNMLLTLDYRQGLYIGGKIPFQNEEEKNTINQSISMASGLMMMLSQGQWNPSNIQIDEHDDHITFNVTIPEEMLSQLKEQARAMQEAGKNATPDED